MKEEKNEKKINKVRIQDVEPSPCLIAHIKKSKR